MSCCGGGAVCSCRVVQGPGITVTGSGTASDPFVVSGAGAAPTVITVTDTPSVDMTITGTGTPGDPYVISSVAAAATPTVIQVTDTASLDLTLTGSGTPADPYILSGVVLAAAPPATGCGIRLNGADELEADTLPFSGLTRVPCTDNNEGGVPVPLDPACEAAGQLVYCDAAGNLRTAPEKHGVVSAATSNEALNFSGFAAAPVVIGNTISISVANPSDCYCLCGNLTAAFIPGLSGMPGSVISIFHEIDFGDGVFAAQTGFVMDNRGKSANSGWIQRPMTTLPVCLDPGETKVLQYRVSAERFTGDNGAAALITALAKDLRFVGWNI
jgi:hypothetical protein